MHGSRLLLFVLAALLLALGAPSAQAKTYCVNYSPCPAGGIPKLTIQDALDGPGGADANPDADVIRIGPGTFPQPGLFANEVVDIIGSGIARTTLLPNLGQTDVVQLQDADSSVSDLSITLPYDGFFSAVRLQNGADAARVRIASTSDSFTSNDGFFAEDGGTLLDRVQTDLGPTPTGSAVSFSTGGIITDSNVVGGIGVGASGPITTVIRRSTIRASSGLRAFGGVAVARNVVVTPHPRDNSGQFNDAVDVTSGNGGENASLTGSHLTLVGPGPTDGLGLNATANNCCNAGVATLNVSNTVVRGFQRSLFRLGRPAPQAANLTLSYSSYDSNVVDNFGNGTLNTATGNIGTNPDPKFVAPSRPDYRLRFDSPLRDKGTPAALAGDSEGDRNGRTRVRDSDGTGGARRDLGAFEYQRLAPVVAFTFSPAQPLIAAPVSFAGSATDPDVDPIAYAWSFGDGGTAGGKSVSHAYGSAGTRQAKLTATDPLGLAASTTRAVPVVAPAGPSLLPGACANRRSGGPGKDRLVGTPFGDRLLGGRGNDRLSGGAGKDCLGGGRGNDRLGGGSGNDRVSGESGNDRVSGDSGNDRLSGGSGKDRLNGGRGRDRISGGSGNDSIRAGGGDRVNGGSGNDSINARNRRTDRIDCSRGRRDRVRADRRDRLRRCERVSRR